MDVNDDPEPIWWRILQTGVRSQARAPSALAVCILLGLPAVQLGA